MSPNPTQRAELLIFKPITLSILLLRSSDSRPIVWCVIGLVVGLGLFFQGFRLLQRRHLILDTPVSKIRSASLGMVELSGLAVGPYTMVAPITGHPCYYYRSVVQEWKRCGRNYQWVMVAAECMHVPFFLDDNTGKVLVDPRGADLDLHRDFQQEFSDSFFTTKEEAPANVRRFLSRHGVSTTNKIKVDESCIKPKNALFLLGTLQENPGLSLSAQPVQEMKTQLGATFSFNLGESELAGNALSFFSSNTGGAETAFEERLSERLAADGSINHSSITSTQVIHLSLPGGPGNTAEMTQQQKITAALLKAGITSPAAWAAAQVTTAGSVDSNNSNGSSQPDGVTGEFDPHPAVVMMKGTNNPTFLISWRSQRDLARSLGWKCTLMIWGGPAVFLLSLYALNWLMNWF